LLPPPRWPLKGSIMTDYIRHDLDGVIVVHQSVTDQMLLAAGDEVPEGVTVDAAHLASPAASESATPDEDADESGEAVDEAADAATDEPEAKEEASADSSPFAAAAEPAPKPARSTRTRK